MTTAKNQRLSVEEIREALQRPPAEDTDETRPAELTEALKGVEDAFADAARAQKRAADKARDAFQVAAEALRPVTYGHGETPAGSPSDEEVLSARGVATEEDHASKEHVQFAMDVLRQLGLFTVKSEENHKALYEGLMEQAMHVAVSDVERGHIVAVSRMTGHSDQTLRRLLELPGNYPGFQATAAPTVKATRWGPRRPSSKTDAA